VGLTNHCSFKGELLGKGASLSERGGDGGTLPRVAYERIGAILRGDSVLSHSPERDEAEALGPTEGKCRGRLLESLERIKRRKEGEKPAKRIFLFLLRIQRTGRKQTDDLSRELS